MSALPIIRSNYDAAVAVRVRKFGTNEDLSTATIKASLKNADKSIELIADTAQSSSATDASWTTGLIIVEFSAAQTAALTADVAWIELAITKGGKRYAVNDVEVQIEKGYTIS